MRTKRIYTVIFAVLILYSADFSQTRDISELVEETQAVARKTAYQAWVENTSDFKQTKITDKNDKIVNAFETICSRKTCGSVLVARNNRRLSEKEILKNREKVSKTLEKAESKPDSSYFKEKENSMGYGILIYDWFNPSLYLRLCRSDFIESSSIEGRATTKIFVHDCSFENQPKTIAESASLSFMLKTEGYIWIDELDKAITKMEIYGRKEFSTTSGIKKPLVIIEAGKQSTGYWFWKSIIVRALENKAVFPKYSNSWEYEFYNYRLSNVEIDGVEIDKK